MILTIDAMSRSNYGAVIMDAWKHGIEVEKLDGYNLELTCAHDDKMTGLIKRHPYVTILHQELIKEVTNGINV
jgi:hypothetical protein